MALICILGLVVFSVLGIFSAKYRAYAKEAWGCALNTVTLRPCDSGLDRKIRIKMVKKVHGLSPSLSRVLNRHFSIFSVILMVVMLWSTVVSAQTIYNLYVYGVCDPASGETCVFNPGYNYTAEDYANCNLTYCVGENCDCGTECDCNGTSC